MKYSMKVLVKISMKFSYWQNFMKFSITSCDMQSSLDSTLTFHLFYLVKDSK